MIESDWDAIGGIEHFLCLPYASSCYPGYSKVFCHKIVGYFVANEFISKRDQGIQMHVCHHMFRDCKGHQDGQRMPP